MPRMDVTEMAFAKLYPLLVAKAEKKGRTREEVDQVTAWLTGYSSEELARLEQERGNPEYREDALQEEAGAGRGSARRNGNRTASKEMCTFLILNISSLQLIPVNMIAYRSQYGSTHPAAIIAPSILATLISTIAAVIYCKIKDR